MFKKSLLFKKMPEKINDIIKRIERMVYNPDDYWGYSLSADKLRSDIEIVEIEKRGDPKYLDSLRRELKIREQTLDAFEQYKKSNDS